MRSLLFAAAVLVLPRSAAGESMRCDGHLIGPGDSILELEARCGAPDHVERRARLLAQGFEAPQISVPLTRRGDVQATSRTFRRVRYLREEVQVWTYAGDGHRFARAVSIRRGQISRVRTVGPLRAPEDPRCGRAVLTVGTRVGIVQLACGTPDDRAAWEEEDELQVGGQIQRRLIQHERWTYNPGRGRLLRVLRFRNGELVDVSTGNRAP